MNDVPVTRDAHGRVLRSLRISVTDRCNLRCTYCMPEKDYVWLPRSDLLSFEEIDRLVGAFQLVGVDRVRLTGGEPLIRKDLHQLVEMLARRSGLRDLAMTTNGVFLRRYGRALRDAGLRRLTVSLDSLDPQAYARMTGKDMLADARAGIEHAVELGFTSVKLNTVVLRGANDAEIPALLRYARGLGAELRFIEYMDVGGATQWRRDAVFPVAEILDVVRAEFGPIEAIAVAAAAPARRFRLTDGTTFGVIASTTQPFCGACDRGRLTADGMWYLCLYARDGVDLRGLLRSGASEPDIVAALRSGWRARVDRGAEERLALARRDVLAGKAELDRDPHLEMHTRGG